MRTLFHTGGDALARCGQYRQFIDMQAGALQPVIQGGGGLGGVAINLAFRQSYQSAHTARPALIGFLAFYAACVAVTALAARRQAAQVRAATALVTAEAAA